ncbi:hypothetical protein ABZ864_39295 [Streptomyces sp. NPDC047082]|uniref:hypothetical protein n=1 Tax=Streptomyces sp. NPDC047082 TaxID=3155259 RepID=UPI0033DBA4DC
MQPGGQQGPEIWIRGPVAEPEKERHPEPDRMWGTPAHGPFPARHFSWVGTHGGAGTSTLAAVYGGRDCGRDWPGPDAPPSVLLVARTHATGLIRATHAVETFRQGAAPPGLDLDAVVLVADAPGRLPRQLDRQVKVIESVIDVYRVPWVEDWRLGDLSGGAPRGTDALVRLTGAAGAGR